MFLHLKEYSMICTRDFALCLTLIGGLNSPLYSQTTLPNQTPAVTTRPARPVPPTRDPKTAGYVGGIELPDGANAPADRDGNFILGPTHNSAPEMSPQEGVPQGTVYNLTMESSD